jgi:hypothetical protein
MSVYAGDELYGDDITSGPSTGEETAGHTGRITEPTPDDRPGEDLVPQHDRTAVYEAVRRAEAGLDGAALTGEQMLDRLQQATPASREVLDRIEQLARETRGDRREAYAYTVGWLTSTLRAVLRAADAGHLSQVRTAAADGLVMIEALHASRGCSAPSSAE